MLVRRGVPLALAAALLLGLPAYAAASQVTTQTDADDGACVPGNCSLRDAVKYGPVNDVINLTTGAYHLSNLLGRLTVNHALTIAGAGAGATTITADGNHRVFDVPAGALTLRGLEVTGGNGEATGVGGGISDTSGQLLTLDHVHVTANSADFTKASAGSIELQGGAGIYMSGPVSITDSSIDNNHMTVHNGGGAVAVGGGGILAGAGAATLTRTEVAGNAVTISSDEASPEQTYEDGGGGVMLLAGQMAVTATTIAGNSVTVSGGNPSPGYSGGGAIYALDTTLTATSSTLSGNSAQVLADTVDNGGGALFTNRAQATFVNSTVANNSAIDGASNAGGGVYRYAGVVKARNTIIAGNRADLSANCLGDITSQGHNLDSGNTCGLTGAGDKISTNPQLGPLAANGGPTRTHALLKGSPAIDAAGLSGCPAADQRGHSRPRGAACDIGAFEADLPNAKTGKAKKVKATSATVTGLVNPNGLATQWRLEFGPAKGHKKKQTAARSAGAGSLPVAVSFALGKLKPGTAYRFRLVATNEAGTTLGRYRTFKTKKKH